MAVEVVHLENLSEAYQEYLKRVEKAQENLERPLTQEELELIVLSMR